MWRKPWLWLILFVVFVGCVIFTWQYFSHAFPIVTLDLSMDRQQALMQAKDVAKKNDWGPAEFKQAAAFRVDMKVQHFVELENGGSEGFSKLMQSGLYEPYTWRIRHYQEGEPNETLIRFTPDGQPYGFRQKLSEDAPGAALSVDSARTIAEHAATANWQLALSEYDLVEESQKVRPSNRIDHTFVYERKNAEIADGRFRLKLVVSGDQLSELTHFVKIPETFSRKYQEMRSANNTLAMAAIVAAAILYIIGGCVFGLYYLIRKRWILWRKPLIWGMFVALLQALVSLNRLPLAWMNYDTALSAQGFLMQQIMAMLGTFIGFSIFLTIIFMVAESLTRKAFPNHIQLWKIWQPDIAGSKSVIGRTILGIWAVGLAFAFDVAFYSFATHVLGWWTPAEALIDPNVLATYFPWLSSIANSLEAGFMEECMFRAIPIAGAALLGQRFGKRGLWIAAAFVVQAFIFGSAHANYPQQPSYARVGELIIPSIGFGLIYLYFGLLAGIISHFIVDVVWFALPIFVSRAPNIWIDQLLVVVLALIPLWIVIQSLIRKRKLKELDASAYNKSWTPPEPEVIEEDEPAPQPVSSDGWSKRWQWSMVALGIVGLILWFFSTNFTPDSPRLNVSRQDAISIAADTLKAKGVTLESPWKVLSVVNVPLGQDDRFIWQNESDSMYHKLMGSFITPPRWQVRRVRFEGDVNERAEEYQVYITKNGKINRLNHILPEAQAGDSLSEEAARTDVYAYLNQRYGYDPTTLKEVSVEPSKLPARTDWLFTFADTAGVPLQDGEARIAVKISGNEIVDAYRFVHVPEEWSRADRKKLTSMQIVQMLCGGIVFLIILGGMIMAVVNWTRNRFALRTFLTFFTILFGTGVIHYLNRWPAIVARFSTAEPFSNQLFAGLAMPLIGLLFISATPALILGFLHRAIPTIKRDGELPTGFGVGCLIAGFAAGFAALFEPSLTPGWAEFSFFSNFIPIISVILHPLNGFVFQSTIVLFLIVLFHQLTNGWTRRRALFGITFVICFFFIAGTDAPTISYWFINGSLTGLIALTLYIFIFRFQITLIPIFIAVGTALNLLKEGMYQAYATSLPGAIIAILLILALAMWWKKSWTTA